MSEGDETGSAILRTIHRRRRNRRLATALGGLVLLGAAVAVYFEFGREAPLPILSPDPDLPRRALPAAPAPPPLPTALDRPDAETPKLPRETAPTETLPELGASDELVRTAVGALARPADLSTWRTWLATDDLIRRFVAAVDNLAAGESPRKHLLPAAPKGRFRVVRRKGKLTADPHSHARYDPLANAFAALPADALGRLYRRLQPLIDQAYVDLGFPEGGFHERLEDAFRELLSTPVLDGPAELRPRVISYEFVDPTLEGLSPAQKQLLRLGPDNGRVVRSKLREFAGALELAEDLR